MHFSTLILAHILGALSWTAIAHPSKNPRDTSVSEPVNPRSLPGWPGVTEDGALLNGTYTITSNRDGTAKAVEYEPLTTYPSSFPTGSPVLERAPYNRVLCDSGMDSDALNKKDLAVAQAQLQINCRSGVRGKKNEHIWTSVGNVVVYFCRWKDNAQCTMARAEEAWGQISGDCAGRFRKNYNPGRVQDTILAERAWTYGYTDWRKHSFCDLPPFKDPPH